MSILLILSLILVPYPELAACYCIANEEPVRIQYKCLVTIDIFQEIKLPGLVISKTHFTENPVYVFPEMKLHGHIPNSHIHVYICERFKHSHGWSDYYAAAK
jgi:hypothetical protein